jgi:hypothetical protein
MKMINENEDLSDSVLESRARRAVKQYGYLARKSRRTTSLDNHGGFQIFDPSGNNVILGTRYDLTAEDILAWCKED